MWLGEGLPGGFPGFSWVESRLASAACAVLGAFVDTVVRSSAPC